MKRLVENFGFLEKIFHREKSRDQEDKASLMTSLIFVKPEIIIKIIIVQDEGTTVTKYLLLLQKVSYLLNNKISPDIVEMTLLKF